MNCTISIFKSADIEENSRAIINVVSADFVSKHYKDKFAIALKTFMKLIFHDLVVKPDQDKEQWILVMVDTQVLAQRSPAKHHESRLNSLSPLFATSHDALMAAEDIGYAHIVSMFKVFKGEE